MKILNNEFDDCINPIELDLRNELSITINTNNLEKFKNMLISLKKDQENILQIDNFFAKKKNEIFF